MPKTSKSTEYWISPLDEHDDSIEVYFYDTKNEARKDMPKLAGLYPKDTKWRTEKVVRKYAEDGELIDEDFCEVEL